jgi:hypothetical protein
MKKLDLTGQTFGMLKVLGYEKKQGHQSAWRCICECGKESIKSIGNLRSGRSKSCGCLRSITTKCNKTRHAMSGTPTYKSWAAMLSRCLNPKSTKYQDYGGRGILVHDAWRSFDAFLSDVGERPTGTTLGRIKNDGHYTPENCEWQTALEQARNKRNTALFMYEGINATIPEHCARLGLSSSTVRSRVYTYKWPIDAALSKPPRPWGGRPSKSTLIT